MENLMFSLNATVPIFLMILLGFLLRTVGWVDRSFAAKLNSFVFKVSLPALLFHDLANVDIAAGWHTGFFFFCLLATVVSILIARLLSLTLKDRSTQGEFIQATYRSSSAILGIAFIQNIYGTSGMGPLMILASVPLYNIIAVTVLTVFRPGSDGHLNRETLLRTARGILTNPIILGIAVGILWSAFMPPVPSILNKFINSIGSTASTLGLIAMGASFDLEAGRRRLRPALLASFMKLIGFCCLFLPLAIHLGFRDEYLVAILVMLGSSTTVTSFVMARNMGHEGALSANVITITTMCCSFTLTFWLYLLRSLGCI